MAVPLAAGAAYIVLRTDWLRRAARWLVRAGGALAGLPWADIGFVVLALTATVAVPVVLGWTAVLVPEAIGMLWRWRLTPTETLRAMAAVAFGIGTNVTAVIWWVWFVFRVSDAASGSNSLAAYGFLWMFITGVEPAVWLRLTIRLRKPTEPDCLAARIVAPRQAELYDRLIGSLERFEEEHYPGERMPLGGAVRSGSPQSSPDGTNGYGTIWTIWTRTRNTTRRSPRPSGNGGQPKRRRIKE